MKMSWLDHWLDLLSSLSLWEWIYWFILTIITIKGFLEYPNILNQTEKGRT